MPVLPIRVPRLAALALSLSTSLALGCSADDGQTCEIATADMSAVALIVDSGVDIRAAVDFELGDRRGRGEPLRLCDTDQFTINGQSPTEIDKATLIEYSLTFEPDADRHFSFVLDREDQGERITFEIDLPAALEILTPIDGDEIAVAEDQRIEWEPPVPDDVIELSMSEALGGTDCLVTDTEGHTYEQLGGVQVPDTGEWNILAGALESESLEPCAATYTLTRLVRSEYPEGFERGGRIEARVERYLDVTIQP